MWSAILLGGCVVGLKNVPSVSQSLDTGQVAEDTSVVESNDPAEPTPEPERTDIWIYTGHGGLSVAAINGRGGSESVQSHWSGDGWTTKVIAELPSIEEMGRPRLLVFTAPGSRTQVRFEPLDIRKIERFLESDGLLALYVDTCSNPHFNTLLSNIGMDIQLSSEANNSSTVVRNAQVHSSADLVAGVERVTMMEPCRFTVRRGTSLVFSEVDSETHVYVASGTPNAGGQVIVLGDFQLIDDAGYFEETDNKVFASILAQRTPATVP